MRTAAGHTTVDAGAEIRRIDDAERYVASICFKTGPPASIGVELEHIVHTADHPTRPLDVAALGVDGVTLAHGGRLGLGPGGQVVLAARPQQTLAALHATVDAELDQLDDLLASGGFRAAGQGIDPHRAPHRVRSSPRYHAMAASFARRGGDGRTMMCSTAGLRPCLDAGPAAGLAERWAAAHDVGPTLLALFANSRVHAGRETGWASTRMRTWYGIDPARAGTVPTGPDPAAAWARYALRAPLLCVRRQSGSWAVPSGVTFADWVGGALHRRPTYDDLDYHLGTLFPLVRPRGHLQIRYLDAQPGRDWFAPVALLAGLLGSDAAVDAARAAAAPAAGRWIEAARYGLTDSVIAATAPAVLDVALAGVPEPFRDEVVATVEECFRRAWPFG
ncbi:glutamate-cysteine ligase family protein [Dactylosporangium sp. AC04546]|uniref:glutamate-cysteine ligase family protein n=1 Tax=Dactylosporangium sp. AC04546 TaxID=2862460 RepID=UPI001EDD7398|nr:glutamate-cysteine ligase family protein [Dactylosporangium sp. AC04546]WVK88654.1 glutamate-cysteine ligase family protein [Dactylosporangium sp. AC04546]